MSSQWDNFLRNLGVWQGSFTSISNQGEELESTASILTLSRGAEERLVHFSLRRFASDRWDDEPIREVSEDYRSLGRQVVFFDSGSFCKGSLQVSPGTMFGGEFGFIQGDRRHRLVELHTSAGALQELVLIREYRQGSNAVECPRLSAEQLAGCWQGEAATITADWPEPERRPCRITIRSSGQQGLELHSDGAPDPAREAFSAGTHRLNWLADGGYSLSPLQVSHRQSFCVEAGWLSAPDRLERLVRCFDDSGAWLASTQMLLERC